MRDFQNIGIVLQLVGMLILFLKILCTADCTGISGKTQLLHALVFTTRFLDLPSELWISLPSFILKIVYLCVAYLTVLYIFVINRKTYERVYDTFRFEFLIGSCILMAMLVTYRRLSFELILWYFSHFMEALAIFPQIHFTDQAKTVGSSIMFYVGMLMCYRGFYVVHWFYLWYLYDVIDNVYIAFTGTVQFTIYVGYFAWMVPFFKHRYARFSNENGQLVTVVSVRANGNDDHSKRDETTFDD